MLLSVRHSPNWMYWQENLTGSAIGFGAQNFYPVDEGAYTGEVSLPMLKELGIQYVLVGILSAVKFLAKMGH